MLDDFTAHDVIVLLSQLFRVVMKKRVIQADLIVAVMQKFRNHRPGAGAKVEPTMLWTKIFQHGIYYRCNEILVSDIVYVVVMSLVACFFVFRIKQQAFRSKYAAAFRAEVIYILKEGRRRMSA
ncbi:MAG: hypothetical protein ACD_39C01472G0001 [uncultured bacterium]|nr:MAG: hypothetical protein ACD_39C01472G0001 [uncultured bacterium]